MQQDSSSRVHSQLYKAVLLLASHMGSIEERLGAAWSTHLRGLDVTSWPVEAQVQFDWIREQLEKMYSEPGKLDRIDRSTAVLVAQNIILLHYSLKPRQP